MRYFVQYLSIFNDDISIYICIMMKLTFTKNTFVMIIQKQKRVVQEMITSFP